MKAFKSSFQVVLILIAFFWGTAKAICLDGRLTLEKEFKRSRVVAIATVVGATNVAEPSDPGGIAATRYDFAGKRLFKGRSRRFSVWIENTSSRVVFEVGQDYLVFVQQNSGQAFVDGCGGSALAKNSGDTIERLEAKGKGVESVK